MSNNKQARGSLNQLVDEGDWALLFDSQGRIKGIYIPDGNDESDVPETIIKILEFAGIDVDDSQAPTIH